MKQKVFGVHGDKYFGLGLMIINYLSGGAPQLITETATFYKDSSYYIIRWKVCLMQV